MSKQIQLTHGKVAIVDDEDFEYLNQWKWHFFNYAKRTTCFVKPGGKQGFKAVFMHKIIVPAPIGFQVDHINGDKLDNRKSNLRICSISDNNKNVGKRSHNTSGFKGVYWHKGTGKWISYIRANGQRMHLGCFECKIQAAIAYNEAALKYHGKFANLNQIPE
jgi:hypothetical protein